MGHRAAMSCHNICSIPKNSRLHRFPPCNNTVLLNKIVFMGVKKLCPVYQFAPVMFMSPQQSIGDGLVCE